MRMSDPLSETIAALEARMAAAPTEASHPDPAARQKANQAWLALKPPIRTLHSRVLRLRSEAQGKASSMPDPSRGS
jgi:hypothetical protein